MGIVIAFGHRQHVGKNKCAEFLSTILRTETRGLSIQCCAFADELKDQCHRLYGWAGLKHRSYYEEHPREKNVILPKIGKSARQVWIDYGTLVGREVYYHTWVDFLFNRPKCDVMIITDLRFLNEFDRVRELNGVLVKVERASEPYTGDIADSPLYDKPNDQWDCIIHNNGTLQELYQMMVSFRKEHIQI